LRLVLGESHALESAVDMAGLDALLRSATYDLLIVDPGIQSGQVAGDIEMLLARHRSLPVVAYTTLSPYSMRATLRLAAVGVKHVVFNRFDDEPARFLELIERVPAHPMADLMLQELSGALQALPIAVARAIEQVFHSPHMVRTSQDLAKLAGVAPRTLYRHLTPVGLQPRHVIVCARLMRAYTLLREPGSRLKEITGKLGYADADTLSHLLQEWTGHTSKEIRRGVPPREFVRLLAERMRQEGPIEVG
jgi:AraC-like DNA-binding protein